jgi:DNA-binding LacI/PurR family transcriptional regulator
MNPPLTTVHVDISALGALATERLLSHMREVPEHVHRQEVVCCTLVVRGSSASTPA